MQNRWSIKEMLEWTTRYFASKGIDNPRLEAEVILAHVLQKDRVYLYANYELPVNSVEREQYRYLIKRRINFEPTAYLTGYKEFMSLKFMVSPAVLIPRPDTELLVEKAIEVGKNISRPRICDVGTGSGAIAVSLAHYLPEAGVHASDISFEALKIAQYNAQSTAVEVHFHQGDLLEGLTDEGPFDIITANLPYIPEDEYVLLATEVKDYEPSIALKVKGDGLDLYRRLLPQALKMLNPGGHLLIEIAWNQGQKAVSIASEYFLHIEILQDMAGRDRVLMARREWAS